MLDQKHIADALSSIFKHRESHVVIALTGRTGSGCTSVAKILATKEFSSIGLPQTSNPPASHEERKSQIINRWLEHKWNSFLKITVSEVILLLVLCKDCADVIDYLKLPDSELVTSDLKILIESNSERALKTVATLEELRLASDKDVTEAHQFIFLTLPDVSENVRRLLNANGRNSYTASFQKFGDNIRRSGQALSEDISPSSLLILPETIGQILKLHRIQSRIENSDRVYVVIDALRHPFEVRYLRERIARFYLVAITTDDEDRKARLNALDYNNEQIKTLDEKEYPEESKDKQSGYSVVVSQDIQACLALADVYISNLGKSTHKDMRRTAEQVVRYMALMQHPGLITPTSIERCMQVAFSAKVNSGCISRQVGAVVTDEGYAIKAVGWNDVPKGQVPCLLRSMENVAKHHDEKAYSTYELQDTDFRAAIQQRLTESSTTASSGRNKCYCFKDVYNSVMKTKNQVHTRSLHAEENAFLQIAKHGGQGIEGGNLFSTASPCELCAKKAFQLGIKNVYYIDPYPGISLRHVFAAGENPPKVILFSGAIGRAYHDLYEPILPFKDEMAKLSGKC
jgi:deoxycytidylate deaminase/dephospho-CoA kinase